MVGTGGSPACPGGCTEAGLGSPGQWVWGSCHGREGSPRPRGNSVSRTDTYRGQTNFMAMSPSGMKLMMTMDDFIPSFIFRKMEQLEAMAVTCHIPANCTRTSPVEFGKAVGTCHLPAGPGSPLQKFANLQWTCRCLQGPATLFRDLPPSVGTIQASMGTCHLPACRTPCPAPCEVYRCSTWPMFPGEVPHALGDIMAPRVGVPAVGWHWTQQSGLTWFCAGTPGSCPGVGSGMELAGAWGCSKGPLPQPAPPAQAGCGQQHPVQLPSRCPSPAARGPGPLPAAGRAGPAPGRAVPPSSSPEVDVGRTGCTHLYSPHCWQHSCPRQLYATGYTRVPGLGDSAGPVPPRCPVPDECSLV